MTGPVGADVTAQVAIGLLSEGNARYVAGRAQHPNQDAARRVELTARQNPIAVVVGCTDSRVPPELLFDVGLGDLFCVRTAGHVLDHAVQGSIEYAVAHLDVPLVVVLGHSQCGAVTATLEHVRSPGQLPGSLSTLVWAITPAVEQALRHTKAQGNGVDPLDLAVQINVANTVARLAESRPILAEGVAAGDLAVVGAVYDIASGAVRWLDADAPTPGSTDAARV